MNKAGHVYTVARGKSGMIGPYKIEKEVINGNDKFEKTGLVLIEKLKKLLIQHLNILKPIVKV